MRGHADHPDLHPSRGAPPGTRHCA